MVFHFLSFLWVSCFTDSTSHWAAHQLLIKNCRTSSSLKTFVGLNEIDIVWKTCPETVSTWWRNLRNEQERRTILDAKFYLPFPEPSSKLYVLQILSTKMELWTKQWNNTKIGSQSMQLKIICRKVVLIKTCFVWTYFGSQYCHQFLSTLLLLLIISPQWNKSASFEDVYREMVSSNCKYVWQQLPAILLWMKSSSESELQCNPWPRKYSF